MKEWKLGTIEEYPCEVIYEVNGGCFYMNVAAEDEESAQRKVQELYQEDIKIVEINWR